MILKELGMSLVSLIICGGLIGLFVQWLESIHKKCLVDQWDGVCRFCRKGYQLKDCQEIEGEVQCPHCQHSPF